jgi:hypothetical protein
MGFSCTCPFARSQYVLLILLLYIYIFLLCLTVRTEVETIRSLDLRFAPHTSLTAVDDGTNLYCFYTSSQNNHIKMIVIKDGKASDPQTVATPTPRSAIAAVHPTRDRIVLFYQSLNYEAGTVEVSGMTFSRVATASSNAQWPVAQAKSTKLE